MVKYKYKCRKKKHNVVQVWGRERKLIIFVLMNANFYEQFASRLHFHYKHQLHTYFDNKMLKRESNLLQSEFIMSNITLVTKN